MFLISISGILSQNFICCFRFVHYCIIPGYLARTFCFLSKFLKDLSHHGLGGGGARCVQQWVTLDLVNVLIQLSLVSVSRHSSDLMYAILNIGGSVAVHAVVRKSLSLFHSIILS